MFDILKRIEEKVDRILRRQNRLEEEEDEIMATLADVQAAQTALLTGVDNLIAQSSTQNAAIAALQAQIAAGTAVTPDQLQAIIDQDTAETAKITAALPSAPVVPTT